MISPETCEIEAIFGSVARRNSDALSDIDFLIVDDQPARLRTRKRWLAIQGVSVSDYTWPRFVRLFEKRTMFAMHLKLESKILCDRHGRYRDLLNSTRPCAGYGTEFDQSLSLFDVLQEVPASPIGRAWALDHTAVAFRNSCILLLANDGEYVFSFPSLIDRMSARGRLNGDEIRALRKLRAIKRAYRSGINVYPTSEDLHAASRAFDHALGLGIHVKSRGSHVSRPICPARHQRRHIFTSEQSSEN